VYVFSGQESSFWPPSICWLILNSWFDFAWLFLMKAILIFISEITSSLLATSPLNQGCAFIYSIESLSSGLRWAICSKKFLNSFEAELLTLFMFLSWIYQKFLLLKGSKNFLKKASFLASAFPKGGFSNIMINKTTAHEKTSTLLPV